MQHTAQIGCRLWPVLRIVFVQRDWRFKMRKNARMFGEISGWCRFFNHSYGRTEISKPRVTTVVHILLWYGPPLGIQMIHSISGKLHISGRHHYGINRSLKHHLWRIDDANDDYKIQDFQPYSTNEWYTNLQPGPLEWKLSYICNNTTTIRSRAHEKDTINTVSKCTTLYMFKGNRRHIFGEKSTGSSCMFI
jgi:hypothetical protein